MATEGRRAGGSRGWGKAEPDGIGGPAVELGGASVDTPPGTLAIIAIRERVTVPAGRFDTVHYTRTSDQSVDEYWKSIAHGVMVKRTHTLPGGLVATATLEAIK